MLGRITPERWPDELEYAQAFKFSPYPLGKEYIKQFKMGFSDGDSIRITVVFDQQQGFDVYIDDDTKQCKKAWRFKNQPGDYNIGHDSLKANHMNAYYKGVRAFKGYIPPKTVIRMHKYKLLSVSDKDLEIVKSNQWIMGK